MKRLYGSEALITYALLSVGERMEGGIGSLLVTMRKLNT